MKISPTDPKKPGDHFTSADENFLIDSKSALLNKRTPFANFILYTIILLILALLIWAYFSPIDQVTTGEGKVIPSSEVKVVQSLDGGIVNKILVHEGEIVKKGQVLLYLDNTRYKSDYEQAYSQYLALLAMTARLSAEANGAEKITFPSLVLSKAPELASHETKSFETNRNALKKELLVLNSSHTHAVEELHIIEPLVKKGIVPKIQYLQTQRQIDEIKSRILEKEDDYHQAAWSDLNKYNAELKSVQESLVALQDKVKHTTILSPVYGIVKKLYIYTVGGVITPGKDIMEIVPMEDTLLIQVRVFPKDIAFIHIGQTAIVRISAYDYAIYGSLKGKVEYVSADAIIDDKAMPTVNPNMKSYYMVHIRTQQNYLGGSKHKLPIFPGMNASAQIITGKKTVMHYILKPFIKAKEEALRER